MDKLKDGGQQAFHYKRQSQSQRANGFRRMLVGLSASLFQPRASSFNGAFPCAVELPDVTPMEMSRVSGAVNPVPPRPSGTLSLTSHLCSNYLLTATDDISQLMHMKGGKWN